MYIIIVLSITLVKLNTFKFVLLAMIMLENRGETYVGEEYVRFADLQQKLNRYNTKSLQSLLTGTLVPTY